MSDEKVLKIDADLDRLQDVLAFVDGLLEAHDCPMKTQMLIDISVEELFVNIAHYAYPDGNGWAEIRAGVEDGVFSITLTDGGIPFNPLERVDPDVTLSAEEREIGGLGIFMVRKKMDEMLYSYEDSHNILTIRKRL